MPLSGVSNHKMIIERAFTAEVLSSFYCGNKTIDTFLHNELEGYLGMGSCKLYIVKDGEDIVAMFCLDNSSFSLSEAAKDNMREGKKPLPSNVSTSPDDFYWYKPTYEATEITYLAVEKSRQHEHIGSSIVESILEKVSQNTEFKGDYVVVRALNEEGYSAITFYKKCWFTPATAVTENKNLFMYRIVTR